ncbi:FadR/GntR family transcriptional regulator [Thalassospira lucentensis]|uniref:FadR/GntR family transcriptional regulator n=1 Tax=Thalassospira lucentensis TaxID=168935 RepID=UPI00399D73E8
MGTSLKLNDRPGERRLYRSVADAIEVEIHAGTYPPGSKLPTERDLSAKIGVSRTTVREALIALEIAGLIRIRMGAGVFVNKLETPQVRHGNDTETDAEQEGAGPFALIDARLMIEPEIAANAAQRRTDADLVALQEAIDRMVAEYRNNADHESGDRDFHLAMAKASGNMFLSGVVSDLFHQTELTLWSIFQNWIRQPHHRLKWIEDHKEVLAAVKAQDRRKARAAMRRHLQNVDATLKRAPISAD